ncbi:unnamed protein product [Ixodes hexagonus]
MIPPSPFLVPDPWISEAEPHVDVTVLLPNGLVLPLQVHRESTLEEVKQYTWREAERLPLYRCLRGRDTYVFTCVSERTSEREEFADEERKLCDVRPFQALLRLVERPTDKADRQTNAQIGLLIGKGLNSFDALKCPEVNEFRRTMRAFCTSIADKRAEWSPLEQVKYRYPARVDRFCSQYPPPHMGDRISADSTFGAEILFESGGMMTVSVAVGTTPQALLLLVMQSEASEEQFLCHTVEGLVLKVCGREEYLLEELPLLQYKYVQEKVSEGSTPQFSVVPISDIQMDHDMVYAQIEHCMEPSFSRSSPAVQPDKLVSAWTIEEPFHVRVLSASSINVESGAKVAFLINIGVFDVADALYLSTCLISKNYIILCAFFFTPILFFDAATVIADLLTLVGETFDKRSKTGGLSANFSGSSDLRFVSEVEIVATGHLLRTRSLMVCIKNVTQACNHQQLNANDREKLGIRISQPVDTNTLNITPDREIVCPVKYCRNWHFAKFAEYRACENKVVYSILLHAAYRVCSENECTVDALCTSYKQRRSLKHWRRDASGKHFVNKCKKVILLCFFLRLHVVIVFCCTLQIQALLQIWKLLKPEQALELLDYSYPDSYVRSFAVRCLRQMSDEELSLYLLQLVQALKHESFLDCDLVKFLLERALKNRHIGHQMFWLLRCEMQVAALSVKFGLILEAYCHGAPEHREALLKQAEALFKLRALGNQIHESSKKKDSREKMVATMREHMSKEAFRATFRNLCSPLDPCHVFSQIKPELCRFMDSKMKPLWLVFENSDAVAEDIAIIFKHGDDLRQDMLTLQMIRIMDKLWKDEGYDFRMIPYQCLSTDHNVGLIEVVRNASTIANIQKLHNSSATSAFKKGSLFAWIKEHNKTQESLRRAVENFTLSCAGYCVATYVLGVADRHSDNIMIKANGELFHIDYGHILGKFKEKFGIKRERVPFVLTHDFVHVITHGHRRKATAFNRFQHYCEQAFLILRRQGSLIISLFAMMLTTGMPELTSEKDLDYLRDALVLDYSEADALVHFRAKFEEALNNSWTTSINWFAHNISKDNK